jgi:hypothetical protein
MYANKMNPCIFCGAPANSGEHLFPAWVLRQVNLKNHGFKNVIEGKPVEYIVGRDIKMSCVCSSCNNGWMSGLETTAKKFMADMIDGKNHHLTKQEQQTLTEWCIKTAMCQDTTEHHERFFSQEECYAFRARRTIPTRTLAWAARCNIKGLDSKGSDFTLLVNDPQTLALRATVFTMQIGQLVLQALVWHMMPEFEDHSAHFLAKSANWDGLTVGLWPTRKGLIKWPPRTSMHKENLLSASYEYFAYRFKNTTGHRMSKPAASSR